MDRKVVYKYLSEVNNVKKNSYNIIFFGIRSKNILRAIHLFVKKKVFTKK